MVKPSIMYLPCNIYNKRRGEIYIRERVEARDELEGRCSSISFFKTRKLRGGFDQKTGSCGSRLSTRSSATQWKERCAFFLLQYLHSRAPLIEASIWLKLGSATFSGATSAPFPSTEPFSPPPSALASPTSAVLPTSSLVLMPAPDRWPGNGNNLSGGSVIGGELDRDPGMDITARGVNSCWKPSPNPYPCLLR